MASRTIATILSLRDQFSSTINKTTKNTKAFQQQIKHTQNQIKDMKHAINGAFSGVAFKAGGLIAGLGIVNFAKDSLMLASSLQEVQNVVDVTFGNSAKSINDWSKTALQSFGLSELQAKQFNGTLGALMKSSGISSDKLVEMSTGLTGLAADFASFYNLKPEEAFDKIKSGISGETEPLKALGINMSVANMEAFALSQGIKKSWTAMSQAEQTTLRYQYLMKTSADAQGDFARTNKGFANQLRLAQTQYKQLGASIASNVLPYANKFLLWANNLMNTAPRAFGSVKTKAMELWNTFNITGKLSIIKTQFNNVFRFIQDIIETSRIPAINFINALRTFSQTIWTDIQPAIQYIKNNIDFSAILDNIKNSTKGVLDIATNTFNFINDNWSTIKPLIEGIAIAWGAYKAVMLAQQTVTTIVTASQLALNAAINANPVGLIITGIGILIGGLILLAKNWDIVKYKFFQFTEFITAKWNDLSTGLKTGIIVVASVLTGGIAGIVAAGILLYQNWDTVKLKAFELWEGIKTAFAPIGDFFSGIWEGVKSGFKSFINFLIDGINNFTDTLSWIPEQLSKVPNFGWAANFVIPKIPAFAKGTSYFTGGLAQINERGGEIVNLPNGSQVIPADKSEKIVNNSGGHTFNFYFNGNVGTEEFFEQAGMYIIDKTKLALANM